MKDLRILVLVEDYPSKDNKYPMAYVHSRIKEYIKNDNLKLTVLSFKAKKSYSWEGIEVISPSIANAEFLLNFNRFVSHAPNIKNHFRFILSNNLKNVVFFIHGHEVLKVNKYYPVDYFWFRKKNIANIVRPVYDFFKLFLLKWFFLSNSRFFLVFVSEWMKREGYKNLSMNGGINSRVIYNPINEYFYTNNYNIYEKKVFDFITVRPLDGSKYCMDIIVRIALDNPSFSFKVIGKGEFFNYIDRPANLTWICDFFTPVELAQHLDSAKVALMPTRLDAQGVMMCELAAYGMPIISSDIPIAKEVLHGYEGAFFINNDRPEDSFKKLINEKNLFNEQYDSTILKERFNSQKLTDQELEVIDMCK